MAWLYQMLQIALVRLVPWKPPRGISCQVLRVAESRTWTLFVEIALNTALSATRPPAGLATGAAVDSERWAATRGTARKSDSERRASMFCFCTSDTARPPPSTHIELHPGACPQAWVRAHVVFSLLKVNSGVPLLRSFLGLGTLRATLAGTGPALPPMRLPRRGMFALRSVARFMAQPSASRALDIVIGPAVENFIFEHTNLSETDFRASACLATCPPAFPHTSSTVRGSNPAVNGAKLAIGEVNGALRASLQGDMRYLEALERSNSLTPALHTALEDEIYKLREEGAETHAALDRIGNEDSCRTTHELTHTQLVVGAIRDFFPRQGHVEHLGSERAVLAIGSHLTVCGRAQDNLWSMETQGQLLEDLGCTIRLTVGIDSSATSAPDATQREYIFEAGVDPDMLLQAPGHDELHFQLADIHSRTDGDRFWSTRPQISVDARG